MSKYLLDTNVALIAVRESHRLTPQVRSAVLGGETVLSIVSYWEVMLKSMKGKLEVGDPRTWWSNSLQQLAATPLGLRADHVGAVYSLPQHHQDPFDRMLIAQAIVGGLTLLTTDAGLSRYANDGLKIVS